MTLQLQAGRHILPGFCRRIACRRKPVLPNDPNNASAKRLCAEPNLHNGENGAIEL